MWSWLRETPQIPALSFVLPLSYRVDISKNGSTACITPREMIHIPQDVLIELAQHLDLGSARNLSRTCKSLRDAGEVKVWEHVDVTSGWNGE